MGASLERRQAREQGALPEVTIWRGWRSREMAAFPELCCQGNGSRHSAGHKT